MLLNNSASPGGGRAGRGVNPPPPAASDPDFIVEMKFTKGNIDLGYFWYTNFWTFGFHNPPPSPQPKLCGHPLLSPPLPLALAGR